MVGQNKDSQKVVCALTGESIEKEMAIQVGLFFDDGSTQSFYMSKEKINELLHESIPRHPNLLPDSPLEPPSR